MHAQPHVQKKAYEKKKMTRMAYSNRMKAKRVGRTRGGLDELNVLSNAITAIVQWSTHCNCQSTPEQWGDPGQSHVVLRIQMLSNSFIVILAVHLAIAIAVCHCPTPHPERCLPRRGRAVAACQCRKRTHETRRFTQQRGTTGAGLTYSDIYPLTSQSYALRLRP